MPWTSITTDTLNEARVAALITACSTSALANGQAARAEGLIQGVVEEIRRKVASHPANRVDEDTTTIPLGLRDLAVDMVIARLKTAIEMPLTEDERDSLRRREKDLDRIADGKDVVDQPDAPVEPEVQGGGGFRRLDSNARRFTRDTGLV